MKVNLLCRSIIFILVLTYNILTFASPGGVSRIIVFGDSLSDLGTYSQIASVYGGGKFTTNPGKLWMEIIADEFRLPISANRQEGYGNPLRLLGGLNYAQGGARVVEPMDQTLNAETARPLTEQLNYFLSEQKKFTSQDLVFIQGGANDLFAQLELVKKGTISSNQAILNMKSVAYDFVHLIGRIKEAGAKQVVVMNLPAVEQAPEMLKLDSNTQLLVGQLDQAFNSVLPSELGHFNIKLLDIYVFDKLVNQNYLIYGLQNITDVACDLKNLPSPSSLFCTSQTLVAPHADLLYKFSDGVHPTTAYSKIVAEFILKELKR
jgi:phospholipase/lecithinase/hemolysin